MRFYIDTGLGPTQAMLPNGALLCQGVTIARTGEQLYHVSEIGADADTGTGGIVHVMRDEDEVFDERSMASFEGTPVTLRHPDSGIAPDNWRALANPKLSSSEERVTHEWSTMSDEELQAKALAYEQKIAAANGETAIDGEVVH